VKRSCRESRSSRFRAEDGREPSVGYAAHGMIANVSRCSANHERREDCRARCAGTVGSSPIPVLALGRCGSTPSRARQRYSFEANTSRQTPLPPERGRRRRHRGGGGRPAGKTGGHAIPVSCSRRSRTREGRCQHSCERSAGLDRTVNILRGRCTAGAEGVIKKVQLLSALPVGTPGPPALCKSRMRSDVEGDSMRQVLLSYMQLELITNRGTGRQSNQRPPRSRRGWRGRRWRSSKRWREARAGRARGVYARRRLDPLPSGAVGYLTPGGARRASYAGFFFAGAVRIVKGLLTSSSISCASASEGPEPKSMCRSKAR